MTSSTPSSVSRYRPAILVLAGAAAAYAAWLLYTSATSSAPAEGLHRSNAVRRANHRPRNRAQNAARTLARLQNDTTPLGEFDFFGNHIQLDPNNIISPRALRVIAQATQPDASTDLVDARIAQLYDTLLDRMLGLCFPDRALTTAETDAVAYLVIDALPDRSILNRALERHHDRFPPDVTEATHADGAVESVSATEAGDWNEDTEGDYGGQTLQRTLYHIAEDRARHEGVVHRGITCNGCDIKPIRGIRWHCANCADFDLCSDCEATNSHVKTHIFYKIRVPAPNLSISKQEPLYPGRPHMMSPSIDSELRKRLASSTRMETEEIDALWDQFTCLAATPWTTDPNGLGWALDRRAFNHAFIPRYSSFKSAPNLIYDRVFAYFDTDHNTLIGFEEFVKGIEGMHATDQHIKLRIVFNGYDVDGDGYVSRKDVLRIFRAHYAIEREATRNYLAESAEEMSVRGALEVIQSAQPLGSAFTQGAIEPDDPNWTLRDKPADDEVDATLMPPIIENRPDTLERGAVIAATHPSRRDGHDGTSEVTDAITDRWARRQFYTDEEEGFTRPEGADDGPAPISFDEHADGYQDEDADEHEPPTLESERPRWSRSSSRVRFQDDPDVETRSNASTSSRPIGERWGGYEVPEAEKDLGKEVLYQITQQAFNELLDPLFKKKEDDAMDAYASREERRNHAAEIDRILNRFWHDKDMLKRILNVGVFTYANCVMKSFCESGFLKPFKDQIGEESFTRDDLAQAIEGYLRNAETSILPLTEPWDDGWQPDETKLWVMMLYRTQLQHELVDAIGTLLTRQGWLLGPNTSSSSSSHVSPPTATTDDNRNENHPADHDPTMPQFRPNSQADLATMRPASPASETWSEEAVPSKPPFGPFFILPARADTDIDNSNSNPNDTKPATEVGTSPYSLPSLGITLSRPFPLSTPTPQPMMHILSLDASTLSLHDETRLLNQHPALDPDVAQCDTFHHAMQEHAFEDADSHLRGVALASLEAVEREIARRKGGGLLCFEEFERVAREGRMRFLEAYWDWVSF